MNFEELLLSRKISVNSLSKLSSVPKTTILDLVRGRSDIRKANGITIFKIAQSLNVTMENLMMLDNPSDIDKSTGKPLDKSYFECSVSKELENILKNLKNAIILDNKLKKLYWKDQLIEEITSEYRKDIIGYDAYEYFYKKYLGGVN